MQLSEADMQKIGRGARRRWSATVTDTITGKRYKVRGAACGAPCHCDAIATELPNVGQWVSKTIEHVRNDFELLKDTLSTEGRKRLETAISGCGANEEFVFSEEDSTAILSFLAAANARFKEGVSAA